MLYRHRLLLIVEQVPQCNHFIALTKCRLRKQWKKYKQWNKYLVIINIIYIYMACIKQRSSFRAAQLLQKIRIKADIKKNRSSLHPCFSFRHYMESVSTLDFINFICVSDERQSYRKH